LAPRSVTLRLTSKIDKGDLWKALVNVERKHQVTTERGFPVFGHQKYIGCVGSQPKRAGVGIRSTNHIEKLDEESWDVIVDFVVAVEKNFTNYIDNDVISMIREARELVRYSTISRREGSLKNNSSIFGAFAFGRNLHLPAHVDRDFTYSVVAVHKNVNSYELDDKIVVYFCFPCLGVAIPMKQGDVIIFNPQEPHAVSSRCEETDDILCLSLYLKSAVVGLNDNSIPNTAEEYELSTLSTLLK
jgi:hypothetical protein